MFRRDAVLYRNAYSHVPLTLPSHVTVLTGLLPPQSGVRDNTGYALGREQATLPALLGDVLARMQRDGEAAAEFRKELSVFPDNAAAWTSLALLDASQGRMDETRRTLDGLLRAAPTPRGYRAAAETLRILGDPAAARQLERRAQQEGSGASARRSARSGA